MSLIKWRDSYNTGIQQFDEEHHKIVELISSIFEELRADCTKETLVQVVAELISYTEDHFSNEEEAMRSVNYPHFEEHLAEHQRLREEVLKFKTKIENHFPQGTTELYRFLREWLIKHILDSDMQYVSYLSEKGQEEVEQ